jgi:ferredoxin
MKVRVLRDVCQGHSMCRLACPEIFGTNEVDGHTFVIDDVIPKALEAIALRAAESCPERAIVIEGTDALLNSEDKGVP